MFYQITRFARLNERMDVQFLYQHVQQRHFFPILQVSLATLGHSLNAGFKIPTCIVIFRIDLK